MSHHPDDIILTTVSKRKLEEELVHIRSVKRPEINEAIRRAREYGDLSENFEYQAARQSQAILNGRVAELEAILQRAKIVEVLNEVDSVGLGTTVLVYDINNDEEWELTIVDFVSADPINDKFSISSPIGRALIGKKVTEIATADTPNGTAQYKILSIRYE
ncbi:transcription elongation factor GreA [Armatimonadota bacterium]|nr:transcription elongation factor GreA [Armatimonadota bacterium]GDX40291.1 transcription elongation factor GreA [Armatimonadota bacterium]